MATERPLHGLRVVVTRAAHQNATLVERFSALGAEPVQAPLIAIAEPADRGAAVRDAFTRLPTFDRVVVASPNAASVVVAASAELGDGVATLPPVACVGAATAAVFDSTPWQVDVVADRSIAEGLVDAVGAADAARKALVVQPEQARPALVAGLRAKGWAVEAVVGYRTIDATPDPSTSDAVRRSDVVTFFSSSAVEAAVRIFGADGLPPLLVSIGPSTSATARSLGLVIAAEADPHSLDGVVAAVVSVASSSGSIRPPTLDP